MKLINKIKKADFQKKTSLWQNAELSRDQAELLVAEMILNLPKGCYSLHNRKYGNNIVDAVYESYGWMPAMFVSQPMMLGLQATHPDKVYATFTLGLDAIEIK
jgi:hypothetical protein